MRIDLQIRSEFTGGGGDKLGFLFSQFYIYFLIIIGKFTKIFMSRQQFNGLCNQVNIIG